MKSISGDAGILKEIKSILLIAIFLFPLIFLVFGNGQIIDLVHLHAKGVSYDASVVYSEKQGRSSRRIKFELELFGVTVLVTESVPRYELFNPKTEYLVGDTITVLVDSNRNLYYPADSILEMIIKSFLLALASASIAIYFILILIQSMMAKKKIKESSCGFEIYFQNKPGEKISTICTTTKRNISKNIEEIVDADKLSSGSIYGIACKKDFIEIAALGKTYQCRSSLNKHEENLAVNTIEEYIKIVESVFINN